MQRSVLEQLFIIQNKLEFNLLELKGRLRNSQLHCWVVGIYESGRTALWVVSYIFVYIGKDMASLKKTTLFPNHKNTPPYCLDSDTSTIYIFLIVILKNRNLKRKKFKNTLPES